MPNIKAWLLHLCYQHTCECTHARRTRVRTHTPTPGAGLQRFKLHTIDTLLLRKNATGWIAKRLFSRETSTQRATV